MSSVPLPRLLHPSSLLLHCTRTLCASLLLLTISCTKERSSQVDLSLRVESSNRPGVFTVSGRTNFPDQSQIIVQGIRPLTAPAQASDTAISANYAILDRQTAVVSQGQWQATLKLWHSTPDGQYQEVWQASQTAIKRLQPSADVIFVAAIDPGDQARALKQQLERQGKTLEGTKVRFTTDEQWYIQAKQTLALTPPVGKQIAPDLMTPELNANDSSKEAKTRTETGAITASLTPNNLPTIKEKQTTAPLSFSQRLH
ncbi:MAG: hypothetical protein ACAF41_09640 [Leptolyngbya sp. BL-A-14]